MARPPSRPVISLCSGHSCPLVEIEGMRVPTLIIFSGLPGTGKTAIARELARRIGATYLRIDAIEQALRDSAAVNQPLNDAGYRVGYALAEENLRLGRTVVADSVNPLPITRQAWRDVAHNVRARVLEIEVQCSDVIEHRRRVETRTPDTPGLQPPTWDEVVSREYHSWDCEHEAVDTATLSVDESVSMILEALRAQT